MVDLCSIFVIGEIPVLLSIGNWDMEYLIKMQPIVVIVSAWIE